jgi:hypothetical protein
MEEALAEDEVPSIEVPVVPPDVPHVDQTALPNRMEQVYCQVTEVDTVDDDIDEDEIDEDDDDAAEVQETFQIGNDDDEDFQDTTLDESSMNIIINKKDLLDFICRTCRCSCGSILTRSSFDFVHRGIATSLNFRCLDQRCRLIDAVKSPKVTVRASTKLQHAQSDAYRRIVENKDLALDDFDINRKFVLAIQRFGQSAAAARSICAFLNIPLGGLATRWTELEEQIAVDEYRLGEEIVADNLKKEKERSDIDGETGRFRLSIQQDGGWTKRASGRKYDSMSGHHIVIGNKTGKVISCHTYSKDCIKCKRHKDGDCMHPTLCARNYPEGSSKGMEGQGCVDSFNELWLNNCIVAQNVSDDDSTIRSLLKRPFQALIDAKIIDSWPMTDSGKSKKTCRGILPMENGEVEHLADINHRCRCLGKYLFRLANKNRSETECTKVDAERIKRNWSYCVHSGTDIPFDEFCTTMKAPLEHLFNNHDYCNAEWCRYLQAKDDEGRMAASQYYRCKEKNAKLYKQLQEIVDPFNEPEALYMVHHGISTNRWVRA